MSENTPDDSGDSLESDSVFELSFDDGEDVDSIGVLEDDDSGVILREPVEELEDSEEAPDIAERSALMRADVLVQYHMGVSFPEFKFLGDVERCNRAMRTFIGRIKEWISENPSQATNAFEALLAISKNIPLMSAAAIGMLSQFAFVTNEHQETALKVLEKSNPFAGVMRKQLQQAKVAAIMAQQNQ